MGLKCSPDIAQSFMENVLASIDTGDIYIDDVGAFSSSWKEHLALLDKILCRLCDNGFTVNPLKCKWAVQETDWLGYWLTPRGLKPWKKKIDAILHMDRPRTTTDIRRFIGCVNFYRDMWLSRLHMLAPLMACSGLKGHTYYSKKLNSAQQNYTKTEKEMLSIVATLEEFRSMLLGANNHVITNHKNLTFDDLKTQRVLQWCKNIEELLPWLLYIEGPKNILADNLSRLLHLPTLSQIMEGKELIEPSIVSDDEDNEDGFLASCKNSCCLDEDIYAIFECYLNLPEIPDLGQNPLSVAYICKQQQQDETSGSTSEVSRSIHLQVIR
jgi:hypothetical protein